MISRSYGVALKPLTISIALSSLLIIAVPRSVVATNLNQQPDTQNLVVNGGFEVTPALNRQHWGVFKAIQGWTATTGGAIEIQQDGHTGQPQQGRNLLELDSDNYTVQPTQPLGVYQILPTTQGQRYKLSFGHSSRPNRPAADNQFSVSFDGKVLQHFADGPGGSHTDWHTYSTLITANSDASRLEFDYTGTRDSYGAYIDNVQLTPISDPIPIAAVAGLGGLAGIPPALASQTATEPDSVSAVSEIVPADLAANHDSSETRPLPSLGPQTPLKPDPITPPVPAVSEPSLPKDLLPLEVFFIFMMFRLKNRAQK
ncbi:MAG: DUF642 domain-containing protein [Cyanobacteria bacterium P01_H01_bin.121]